MSHIAGSVTSNVKCEVISFTRLPCPQPWVNSILNKIPLAEVLIVLNSCLLLCLQTEIASLRS